MTQFNFIYCEKAARKYVSYFKFLTFAVIHAYPISVILKGIYIFLIIQQWLVIILYVYGVCIFTY